MESIDLCHKIVVLALGGRLAYFGPPQEAKAFFGIDKFCDLYDRMEEQTPEGWQTQYRQSKPFAEHVAPVEQAFLGEQPVVASERGGVSPLPLGRQPRSSCEKRIRGLTAPPQRNAVGRESQGIVGCSRSLVVNFFRPKGPRTRSPSQGQRPWEQFVIGILAPTGQSFA